MHASRWSDHDRYLGPFTFAFSDCYRTLAICLQSSDDEERAATFRLSVGRFSFLSVVPKWVIRPERRKVGAKYWSAQDIERVGRDWYWEITPREYGLSISEGHLNVSYGRVTHDSSTEQRWGCFLPWTQWRHVRHSFYGLQGEHLYDEEKHAKLENWEQHRAREDAVPTVKFAFKDFDGADLIATTKIEEREWRFGAGYFKWLSLLRPAKISRSLKLDFSDEVGPEKGSWKGGTVGHSVDMLPGELHEEAFRRYCDGDHRSKYRKYKIEFVGVLTAA